MGLSSRVFSGTVRPSQSIDRSAGPATDKMRYSGIGLRRERPMRERRIPVEDQGDRPLPMRPERLRSADDRAREAAEEAQLRRQCSCSIEVQTLLLLTSIFNT